MFETGAKFIFLNEKNHPNRYTEYKREFTLKSLPGEAAFSITVEDEYVLYVNGQLVDCGMYDDYPGNKSVDTLELAPYLREGDNSLRILTHWQGVDSFQNVPNTPRLKYSLSFGDEAIISDKKTLCRPSGAYLSGPVESVSPQLSFSFHYDARKEDTGTWVAAAEMREDDTSFYPRPTQKLTLLPFVPGKICMQGVLREDAAFADKTPAVRIQTDFISPRYPWDFFADHQAQSLTVAADISAYDGYYIVVDLGREEAGFPVLDIQAPEGTVIDVAYGEHLDDGRVRASVGTRNFAFRYICKEGRQYFAHMLKRIAGRYMQLHVRSQAACTFHGVGIIPAEYPVSKGGSFHCADSLVNRIWDVSVRTLILCMHEHYEDCPWREQALYAMDSRNQALAGYYAFGEYAFPAASFSLLAESLRSDGYMEICAPCRYERTIPSFTYAWVIELGELYRFSGNASLVEPLLPAMHKVLSSAIERMENGLLPNPQGKGYWHFYEWADTLHGAGERGGKVEAPLNLFFYGALGEAVALLEGLDRYDEAAPYKQAMESLADAFHDAFWRDEHMAYATVLDEDTPMAELCQSLALFCGLVPMDLAADLRAKLAEPSNGMIKTSLSHYIYKIDALMQEPGYAVQILEDIRRDWGMMLYQGATSFWETLSGADDFAMAGSLCHGWSAAPVYFLSRYVLGAYPATPGFGLTSSLPHPVLEGARGTVPLPGGRRLALPIGIDE